MKPAGTDIGFDLFDDVVKAPSLGKLREQAKTQLGSKFDIKAFHDAVLNGGAMPLDLLQKRVEFWIKDQGANTAIARASAVPSRFARCGK